MIARSALPGGAFPTRRSEERAGAEGRSVERPREPEGSPPAGEALRRVESPERREPVLSSTLIARAARVAIVAWALVGLAILAYLIGRFVLYPIRIVFPPLVLALVLVYLLNPAIGMLERRGLKRLWATLLTYLVFLTVVGVTLAYLIPVVSHQVTAFAKSIPDLLQRAENSLADFARRLGLHVKASDLVATFQRQGGVGKFIGRISSLTGQVLHVALVLVLGPILAFYLLVDLPKLRRSAQAAIPARRRGEAQEVATKLAVAVGGYFRGQLLVALFVGIASMFGLWVVGLPYWAPIGLIAGLFNLIPLIGPFIGAIPALFVAFTTPVQESGLLHPRPGWPLAVAASVVLLVVQQIDNHVISPRVVTRTVRLHPLTVMLSLLAAGAVLGLWGMLLVIPVVAAAKILIIHYWDTRMVWPPRGAAPPSAPVPAADETGSAAPPAPPEARPEPSGGDVEGPQGGRWRALRKRWSRPESTARRAK